MGHTVKSKMAQKYGKKYSMIMQVREDLIDNARALTLDGEEVIVRDNAAKKNTQYKSPEESQKYKYFCENGLITDWNWEIRDTLKIRSAKIKRSLKDAIKRCTRSVAEGMQQDFDIRWEKEQHDALYVFRGLYLYNVVVMFRI